MDASQAPRARGTASRLRGTLPQSGANTAQLRTDAHQACGGRSRCIGATARLHQPWDLPGTAADRGSSSLRSSHISLQRPQSASLPQAPTCWPERHSLCRPGLGPWAPSSLDLGCKSTSLFWAPGHSAGECRVPGAQLAIGLRPSYLQDPPSPTAPCGLRWLLQLPT